MARRTRAARGIALAAITALALAACGGDNGDDDGEDAEDVEVGDIAEDVLQFGQISPETGELAELGPPQVEALRFAVESLNEAGGVLGNDVPDPITRDEAGQEATVVNSANDLLREGVNAVIGPAASGMSLSVIDRITGNEIVQCSGSNTAPAFTDYEDDGYYFRTAPSDQLQGPLLANEIVGDGHGVVAMTARADDYGRGLMEATAASLENEGVEVAMQETYNPDEPEFSAIVEQMTNEDPDAVVMVSFDEGVQVIQEMIEAGIGPDEVGVYSADGMRMDDLGEQVAEGDSSVVEGMKGTAPGFETEGEGSFVEDLQEFSEDLQNLQFAPQVYDCAILIALAAEKAESTTPADFAGEIVGLTKDGEDCSTFEDCKQLLEDGEEINYNGVSGPLNFIDAGEPNESTIETWEVNAEGSPETTGSQDISFDDIEDDNGD